MNADSKQVDFNFTYLPGFADFILREKFEEYLQLTFKISQDVNLPLLQYFNRLTNEEKDKIARESSTEFLSTIRDRKFQSFIDKGIRFWVDNQLPVILKDQVVVEDITLVNY